MFLDTTLRQETQKIIEWKTILMLFLQSTFSCVRLSALTRTIFLEE